MDIIHTLAGMTVDVAIQIIITEAINLAREKNKTNKHETCVNS
jgi:hypothetical protein